MKKRDRVIVIGVLLSKLLFVDDEREWPVGGVVYNGDVYQAYNSSAAIDLIQDIKFDILFLDHDLGENDTGMEVVDFLINVEQHPEIQQIFIHSQNPIGARNMENRLHPWYDVQRLTL